MVAIRIDSTDYDSYTNVEDADKYLRVTTHHTSWSVLDADSKSIALVLSLIHISEPTRLRRPRD